MKNAQAIFRNSSWIWANQPHWDLNNGYVLFRKSVTLDRVPRGARLFITADQSYQLYINGNFVNRGPARGFQSRWPFDEVPVESYLKKGDNLIAIRAYNPGYSNFQYIHQGVAGLLVAGTWGKVSVSSDESWKSRRQSGVTKGTVQVSVMLFSQEHIDLREEPTNWMKDSFNDQAWEKALITFSPSYNRPPWTSLEARGIPLMEEKTIKPLTILGVSQGKSLPQPKILRDVVIPRYREGLQHDRKESPYRVLKIAASGREKFQSYLIDFGKTQIGSLKVEIKGSRGGEIIDTFYGETIDKKTLAPDFLENAFSHMAFGGRLICSAQTESHLFYHAYGFRYLIVTVRDSEGPFEIDLSLQTIRYPFEWKGRFESSEADLNKIWQASAWTQQVCCLDAFVDTPWREQAQWWGDALIQGKTAYHLSGDTALFRRGIDQIAFQKTEDGLTYSHAPTTAHYTVIPDFSLMWILTVWEDYWRTGSIEIYQKHHETVWGMIRYFEAHSQIKTGLIQHDPRYWLFLDWREIYREGYPTVYNLLFLMTLEKVLKLEKILHPKRDLKRYRQWGSRLRQSLLRLRNAKGQFEDGLTVKGKRVKSTSIQAQTLAILAELDPANDLARLNSLVLPWIRGEIELGDEKSMFPSAAWTTYVFDALKKYGYEAEIIQFIRRHWTVMAEYGTTWEDFKPSLGNFSHSHAWSAHPLSHLMSILGGVIATKCGSKEIQFKPFFYGKNVEVKTPLLQGVAISGWKRVGNKIDCWLKLPKGVEAIVHLPGQKVKRVRGTNHRSGLTVASTSPVTSKKTLKKTI